MDVGVLVWAYNDTDTGNWAALLDVANASADAAAIMLEARADNDKLEDALDESLEVMDASKGLVDLREELAAADGGPDTVSCEVSERALGSKSELNVAAETPLQQRMETGHSTGTCSCRSI